MTDRVTTWPGAIPQELDIMRNGKYAMMGIAKLAAAMLGTSTVVNGLTASPTSPAGLTINVGPGEIYSLVNVDATAQSSLAADTTHSIMKSGILMDAVNLSCPAPGTVGQSINYLIQATYQDQDTDLTALPYYNASNPTQAWSGPNNSGTAQATTRKGIVVLSAKAGVAATTGSQTTPAADSGYTGLWVVTVANGQTTITAPNIVQATNAPILPSDLLHAIQASSLINGADTGAANACVVSYSPAIAALKDGMVLWFKAAAANTSATTLNVNGLGAYPIVGGSHSALQGGEIIANGKCQVVWNATLSSFVLIECTGAAVQVAPATQSKHALQMGQVAGVVGSARNLAMSVTAASASATMTADEIIVESALGGLRYCLPSFNKTINLATNGAGGMDVGSAPNSGFVALYAIYNPATGTSALLAANATSAAVPNTYGGVLPSGYLASALVSVWPTNGSGQFVVGYQIDREVDLVATLQVNTTTQQASPTSLAVSGGVPPNAKSVSGTLQVSTTSSSALASGVSGSPLTLNQAINSVQNANLLQTSYANIKLVAPQTLYYQCTAGIGTMTFQLTTSGYRF
ncbi:hypothetical protein 8G_00030 [Ralstonia phage Hyacinthe]|uniref:Tail fiber protein n=3 Tax=Rahariannevirus raharianne TaxID=2846050 RepID=A0A7G5BBE5_9CAUD|nr:hypothetical protein KMC43_gp49 [Ralstonia phage Raharianne]QMV32424.1 hypothetical protein U2_00049 [Ralstonia phage Albius]QMV33462.1 hypothetical protein 8G_00030 [Ralstonia phage Hyacinthe]QMV33618.1 hypothetical protein Y2_00049 [Ralstonia phage Raharianne]